MARWVVAAALACACATGSPPNGRTRSDGGARDARVELPDSAGGCEEGTTVPCTLSCGAAGTSRCMAGRLLACEPGAEECNGEDEDCDGAADEGIMDRMCTAACGGGISRCAGGRFEACMGGMPVPETCDNSDQDCDGAIDESLMRTCMAACGPGFETCRAGVWSACEGPAPMIESCDGSDQDCDGRVDESLTRACATACGMGLETCSAGTFAGCTAPSPVAEACDREDDDCDGRTDEGFVATLFDAPMSELTAAQPACDGPFARLDVCLTAAKRWCHSRPSGCYTTGGAGFLTATFASARVICFGFRGDEHNATYAAISATASTPISTANVHTRVAQSAVNRYCGSRGSAAGIGPTEWGETEVTVTCLPSDIAETVSIATSDLTVRGCDPIANPDNFQCQPASDEICRARGFAAGYGPVEWNTTDSAVVCFRTP